MIGDGESSEVQIVCFESNEYKQSTTDQQRKASAQRLLDPLQFNLPLSSLRQLTCMMKQQCQEIFKENIGSIVSNTQYLFMQSLLGLVCVVQLSAAVGLLRCCRRCPCPVVVTVVVLNQNVTSTQTSVGPNVHSSDRLPGNSLKGGQQTNGLYRTYQYRSVYY